MPQLMPLSWWVSGYTCLLIFWLGGIIFSLLDNNNSVSLKGEFEYMSVKWLW